MQLLFINENGSEGHAMTFSDMQFNFKIYLQLSKGCSKTATVLSMAICLLGLKTTGQKTNTGMRTRIIKQ